MVINKKGKNLDIAIFEQFEIRRQYDEQTEKWYFSVIDIVSVLTEQVDYKKAQSYWITLKSRLKSERSELVTNCDQLKMLVQDEKMRLADITDVEVILRLAQSIPSKKLLRYNIISYIIG